jgi:hypothetical protein
VFVLAVRLDFTAHAINENPKAIRTELARQNVTTGVRIADNGRIGRRSDSD